MYLVRNVLRKALLCLNEVSGTTWEEEYLVDVGGAISFPSISLLERCLLSIVIDGRVCFPPRNDCTMIRRFCLL